MNIDYDKYEAVIGLEVHTQLLTNSKAYSSDSTEYGAMPNTNVSAISLGHPGTLPRFNKKAVEFAIRLGTALGCTITERNEFARKNYFYADLPKGYQITQDTTPICTGGSIEVKDKNGNPKTINLTRIHMEEDSGKSIHDQDPFNTLIDLNRAGVALLEIVTEPDFRSAEETYSYLTELRKLVRYLEISDGNMEESSLRCDANISVRLKGAEKFGTKVEVKNMNSIRNVFRAIEHEIKRQIEALEAGEAIYQETRNFDAVSGTTLVMRSKEDAHDYRYFPEPDLHPVMVTQNYVEEIRSTLPPLPSELLLKYQEELGLSEYDATNLTDNKGIALYFEELTEHTTNTKAAANWMMGSIKSHLNKMAIGIQQFPIKAERIAQLIKLIDDNKVSNSVAEQKLFPLMLESPDSIPSDLAQENNLIQESNTDTLQEFVSIAIAKYPEKVAEYKSGKKGLIGLFMGEVMKLSKGKADPKLANKLVTEELEK